MAVGKGRKKKTSCNIIMKKYEYCQCATTWCCGLNTVILLHLVASGSCYNQFSHLLLKLVLWVYIEMNYLQPCHTLKNQICNKKLHGPAGI